MGGCHSYLETSDTNEESFGVSQRKMKKCKQKARLSKEEKPYLLDGYARAHLGRVDMRVLCVLPEGLDEAEWVASHTVAFYQHINLLSSALSEFCTGQTCPVASGPNNITYYWTDDHGKRVRCSGPLYTDYTMYYIHELLTDEEVFPTKTGSTFPSGFTFMVQRIFTYLFHMLAHLYSAHFQDLVRVGLHPHVNTLFAHLVNFCNEFQLLEPDEAAPLQDLFSAICRHQST